MAMSEDLVDAVILCGGRGTRLASVVSALPKPMAPVHGRPFLDYLLDYLAASGVVKRVLLASGHLAATIESHYGIQYRGLPLCHSAETAPLGTGGAVRLALDRHGVTAPFLLLNGDSFIDADLRRLLQLQRRHGALAALALHAVDDASRFGRVTLAGDLVTGWAEKSPQPGPGLINAGVYALDPRALPALVDKQPLSLETAVLPALVARGAVRAVRTGSRFIDIGLPETYGAAAGFFRNDAP